MKPILVIFCILSSFFFSSAQANEQKTMSSEAKTPVISGNFETLAVKNPQTIKKIISPIHILTSQGNIIELSGIHIPNINALNPSDIAVLAKAYLDEKFSGTKVNIYQFKDKSKQLSFYGHTKAQLETYNEKNSIQGELLSRGLARVFPITSNPEITSQMYSLEQTARENKKGLWNNDAYKTLKPSEAVNKIGQFGIIEGTIQSVSVLNNFTYLNFEIGTHKGFRIKITPQGRKEFLKASLNPMKLSRRKIRVRGFIEGPSPNIVVNHPIFLELLSDQI